MTFPTTEDGKREAYRLMVAAAPELMAQVAELRKAYGGKVTYYKAGALEYGEPAPQGWQIDEKLIARVKGPTPLSPWQQERNRKERLAAQRRKAKR